MFELVHIILCASPDFIPRFGFAAWPGKRHETVGNGVHIYVHVSRYMYMYIDIQLYPIRCLYYCIYIYERYLELMGHSMPK